MNLETIPIKVQITENSFTQGILALHEQARDDADAVQLDLSFLTRRESIVADDFFEALALLRKKLEPENIWLFCNGAVKSVWPSGMSRSMGNGLKAYNLVLGKAARTEDLVTIFENTLNLPPSSVQDQQAFFQLWLQSLRKE